MFKPIFFTCLVFMSGTVLAQQGTDLSGCWSGLGARMGSLGNHLDSCPAKFSGNFEKWPTGFSIDTLEFMCRHDVSMRFGKLDFAVVNNRLFLETKDVGTIAGNALVFDFRETSQTDRVTITRDGQNIKIKIEVIAGVGVVYSYVGKLTHCQQ